MEVQSNVNQTDDSSDITRYENIVLARAIFCSISFSCCFFLIIIYVIYCMQIKLKLFIKKEEQNEPNEILENDYSDTDTKSNKNNNTKSKQKIGLGSNFMFFLTISNFFGALFEFLFYFYSKSKNEDNLLQKYQSMNEDNNCHLLGFAHNFFDLLAVCWTTMLTLLFYRSTNLSNEMLYHDNKYLIIGFIYSFVSCTILCGIPLLIEGFGFAGYYCSFKYIENFLEEPKEKIQKQICRYIFVIFTTLNNLINVYWLIKTYKFYSKKLKIIKNQNKNEYKLMLIYVWVFRIFPIVLIVSRLFKGLSRLIIENIKNDLFNDIVEYINGFLFASNGIFDSIACAFFFRGVFWCCTSNTNSRTLTQDAEGSDLNYLGGDVIDE